MTFGASNEIHHQDTKTQSDYSNENKPCSILSCLYVFVSWWWHDSQKTNFTCANKLNSGFFGSMITSSRVQTETNVLAQLRELLVQMPRNALPGFNLDAPKVIVWLLIINRR